MRTLPLLLLFAGLAACGGGGHGTANGGSPDAGTATEAGAPDSGLPAPVCNASATPWTPGTQAFRDATSDAQLDTAGALGVRISAVDIDGDGYEDLAVRLGGAGHDVVPPGTPTARAHWLLHNRGDGTFEDVTLGSGILTPRQTQAAGVLRPGEIWVFGDVDNDGDADAFTAVDTSDPTTSLGETSEIMLNDGAGHFSLGPSDSDLRDAGMLDTAGGASFVDYDRDGYLDIWVAENGDAVTSGEQSQLYRGDGTGHFTRVTLDVGLKTEDWTNVPDMDNGLAHARSWSAAACDLEGDGTLDLLAGSYGRSPNLLFVGHRADDGTAGYTNLGVASGYAYDADMVYTDNQFYQCYCQSSPTDPQCAGAAAPMISCTTPNWDPTTDTHPFRLGGNSGTTVCADVDGDGDLDLLTSEIQHWWAGEGSDRAEWLLNDGTTPLHFTRPGRDAMGIVVPHTTSGGWDEGIMTAAVLDFDLDGRPDFYLGGSDYPGNHGLLYHQASPMQFESVPIDQGIDQHRSHGVVVTDYDHDGDLDVVVGHSFARCSPPTGDDDCYATQQVRLWQNVAPQGSFVELRLVGGSGTNREAIGARVSVVAAGLSQVQEVDGGHGHYGIQNDAVLTFGLGTDCAASVTVRWPDAALTTETFTLPAGHRYRIEQGKAPAKDGF